MLAREMRSIPTCVAFANSTQAARLAPGLTLPAQTYLYWKIYDGGIVEAKSAGSKCAVALSLSVLSAQETAC